MKKTDSSADLPDKIQQESNAILNHPLAMIAGQFEGDFWEATLKSIKRQRNVDRKQWQKMLEVQQNIG